MGNARPTTADGRRRQMSLDVLAETHLDGVAPGTRRRGRIGPSPPRTCDKHARASQRAARSAGRRPSPFLEGAPAQQPERPAAVDAARAAAAGGRAGRPTRTTCRPARQRRPPAAQARPRSRAVTARPCAVTDRPGPSHYVFSCAGRSARANWAFGLGPTLAVTVVVVAGGRACAGAVPGARSSRLGSGSTPGRRRRWDRDPPAVPVTRAACA
jgi:hypothetical protein